MTIKLAILKSGEDVIADIKELISEDEKVVSYVFTDPFSVKLIEPEILTDDDGKKINRQYSLSVYPWIPLTEQKDIAVNPDWIVSIVEPAATLKKSYEEKVYGRISDETTNSDSDTSEQLESNN
jgi:hypothetical protein